jgi:DNA-binding LacI/PurR family transcriptional regulator
VPAAKKSVTSRDVARASGVSQATVSYVINNNANQTISPETRERVLTAAKELGYIPNEQARALRSGKSNIALVTFPDFTLSHGFDTLIESLASELRSVPLSVVLHRHVANDISLRSIWQAIKPRVMIDMGAMAPEILAAAKAEGFDVITFALGGGTDGDTAIEDDQRIVGRLQAEHLVARGHRRIGYAFLDAPNIEEYSRPRFAGVQAVLAEADVPEPVSVSVVLDPASCAAAIDELRAAGVTAICAYNDDVAIPLLSAAIEKGLRVPDDLAIIGVDDVPLAASVNPPLTSVEIDMRHLAVQVARKIVAESSPDGPPLEPMRAVVRARGSA